jgi:hypothetical protein
MAKIVCLDALIYLDNAVFPERNEASVSFDIDIAEARPFVASAALAFVNKAATWKDASVSLNGYYDSVYYTAIDDAIDGGTYALKVYPTRSDLTKYWSCDIVISSLEHTITSEDFSELNIEGSVSGALTFVHP